MFLYIMFLYITVLYFFNFLTHKEDTGRGSFFPLMSYISKFKNSYFDILSIVYFSDVSDGIVWIAKSFIYCYVELTYIIVFILDRGS